MPVHPAQTYADDANIASGYQRAPSDGAGSDSTSADIPLLRQAAHTLCLQTIAPTTLGADPDFGILRETPAGG